MTAGFLSSLTSTRGKALSSLRRLLFTGTVRKLPSTTIVGDLEEALRAPFPPKAFKEQHRESQLFKTSTIRQDYDLTAVVCCAALGAGLALSATIWSLLHKEDVRLNHHKKVAPYEEFDLREHRYNLGHVRHHLGLPEEVVAVKKALGPFQPGV